MQSLIPTCLKVGCSLEATCQIGIKVPAKGWPLDQHEPLEIITGVTVCDQHFDPAALKVFLTDQLKDIVKSACKGRQPPDFTRAFLVKASLHQPQFEGKPH